MDARKFPRFPIDLAVTFSGEDLEGEGHGRLSNLSMGGCAVASDRYVPLRSYVELRIHLPEGESIHVTLAATRWSNRGGFGAEFLLLEPTEKARLTQLVEELAARSVLQATPEASLPCSGGLRTPSGCQRPGSQEAP